jgi:hypothetical protein
MTSGLTRRQQQQRLLLLLVLQVACPPGLLLPWVGVVRGLTCLDGWLLLAATGAMALRPTRSCAGEQQQQ